ncbi:MAG: succinate dehydrogenase [Betaproteobacteria bacterium]
MTATRWQTWLWLAQRGSAAVLALCVLVHLVTMIVVVQGGLTAGDILGRTRGNAGWAAFYATFVLAVAIHAPIGVRTIATEWLGVRGRAVDGVLVVFGGVLAWLGWRAVAAVTGISG